MDDVVIVGGGIIGAASAYFLSKEGRKVKVIERDPTYKTASFPLSLGGFRRQFFQKENILLGKFAREFIYQIPDLLKTEKNPNPTASMVTNGYLLMFGPEHADEQYKALENHKECEAGTKNIKGSELSKVFPYINNDGIETATYTDNQSEGWIDPFMFHSALKSKAIELGAEFIKGEVKSISEIKAKTIISAAGCWTKELLEDIPSHHKATPIAKPEAAATVTVALAELQRLRAFEQALTSPLALGMTFNMNDAAEKRELARQLWMGDYKESLCELRRANPVMVEVLDAQITNSFDRRASDAHLEA